MVMIKKLCKQVIDFFILGLEARKWRRLPRLGKDIGENNELLCD